MGELFFAKGAARWLRNLAVLSCVGIGLPALSAAQASTYTAIYDFKAGITDGVEASGPLTPGPNGSFYGVTAAGGTYTPDGGACMYSCGTVFKLTPVANKKKYAKTLLFKFSGGNGLRPAGQIAVGADGSIYGATISSWDNKTATYAGGVVYQLTPPPSGAGAWTEKVILRSVSTLYGVIADGQGRLYGVGGVYSLKNGTNVPGSVFQLTPPASSGGAWKSTTLHAFAAADDYTPNGDLTMDAGGAIYGSSPFAGAAGQGQIFRITLSPKVSYSVLHEFTGTGGAADAGGGQPYSGVVVGPGGVLYGATFAGGSVASPTGYASGVVYSLTPPASAGAAWGYQVLHSFDYYNGGFGPWGGVTLDPSGVLYGTTNGSNQYSPGVMYKISPPAAGATGWTETDVYQLPGYGQHYRMFQDGAGVLYGSSDGEIFKFKP